MTAGRMRFLRDTPYTHSVGRKRRCPNCARQAKRYGCALLYGGASRLTADDSLPFARLPIGAPGEGKRPPLAPGYLPAHSHAACPYGRGGG